MKHTIHETLETYLQHLEDSAQRDLAEAWDYTHMDTYVREDGTRMQWAIEHANWHRGRAIGKQESINHVRRAMERGV